MIAAMEIEEAGAVPGSPDPAGEAPGDPRRGTAARRLALECILQSDGGRRQFIDEVLEERLAGEEIPPRDRHLLQEIAYGSVRHRNTLDHLLDVYLPMPMKRQRPAVRWALRLAAYQGVYLTRIPPHAAIDRTIEALKAIPGSTARDAGFLNAVLRKLAGDVNRKSTQPPLETFDPTVIPIRSGFCHFRRPVMPLHSIDPVPHLALRHSHPAWLVERWRTRLGEEEAIAILAAGNSTPPITARITALAPSAEAAIESLRSEAVEVESIPGTASVVLSHMGNPRDIDALRRGWIQIQDPTATAIGEALRPPAGARVLDLCAAPGGKAVQILERLGPGGSLLACDVDEEKLARVSENLARTGGTFEARKVPHEPEAIDLGERFSHILLDAPCSNTGVLARRPEARWRIHRDDIVKLSELQRKLLAAAHRHLAPGGRLLYATCSIEPEENEVAADRAVTELPGLAKVEERLFLPRHGPGDGGYYALLERTA
jgi:16S rRNA (cytosine967-C5)-methyltransferase